MNDIKLATSERNNPMLCKVRLQMYVWLGASLSLIIKGNRYPEIWDAYFKRFGAMILGIGGGRTEHVVWRIENVEIKKCMKYAYFILYKLQNILSLIYILLKLEIAF